jgi:hypothetical protein
MRVTITRKPEGAVGGVWLASLQVGHTYNLGSDVASNLILERYAIEERRWGDRRKARRPESPGRRHDDYF